MKTETFADVWDAIEDTPEKAASARLRSQMMMAVTDAVRGWKTTQADAARRLGITQPRLNQLLRGRLSMFSLGALTDLAERAGIGVTVKLKPVPRAQAAARTSPAPSRSSRPLQAKRTKAGRQGSGAHKSG